MSILANEGVEPNVETMKATAKALGIKLPRGRAKPETIVKALRKGFGERLKDVPQDDWIKCPACGEVTDDDERIELCPFCGDEGVDDEEVEETELDPAEAELDDTEEEPEGALEASEVDDEDLGEAEEPPTVDLDAKAEEEPQDEPEAEEEAPEPDPEPEAEEEPSKLAKGGEAMLTALEEKKETIRSEQTKMIGASYELGVAIRDVREGNLWKAEGHGTFRKFCESMGISHTLAYGLIDIVEKFDKATFLEVGRKKLSIVARADKEDRDELLEDAKSGKSVRDLDKKARAKKEEKSGKGEPSKERDPDAPKPGRPKKEDQTIVLVSKVGGKAKSYAFHDRETRDELKTWKKDAYAQIQLSDEVFLLCVLKTNKEGEPVAIHATFRRATTTEESDPATTKAAAE